jgi:ABC-2 type transport system ATP-binding protein
MSHPLELSSVSKQYVSRKHRVDAVREVSFAVAAGEIFGFLGPNGAGKSTTIKIIMNLIRADRGTATIFGTPSTKAETRRHVGFLPENPALYDYMTGAEYLRFVGNVHGMPKQRIRQRSDELLTLLDLLPAAKRAIRSYSKGMLQKLGLAQAIIHDPPVLILDEPMSGLDPLSRVLVKELIVNEKKNGKTVFFSTHIISDVERVCDRVGIIRNGILKAVKEVAPLLREGIEAYRVRFAEHESSAEQEIMVSPDDLTTQMVAITSTGGTIRLLEPVRKNLEDFFLHIIRED